MPYGTVTHKPSGKPVRAPRPAPTPARRLPAHTVTAPTVRQAAQGPAQQRAVTGTQRLARNPNLQRALRRVLHARNAGGMPSTFNPEDASTLIRSVGGTKPEAQALSTKVAGESGGNPRAKETPEASGAQGLGLWQLTTGVGIDDLINAHGGRAAMLKPRPNAKAALDLYRSSGGGSAGIANWHAPSGPAGSGTHSHFPSKKPPRGAVRKLRKAGVPLPTRPTEGAKAPTHSGKVPGVVKLGKIGEKKFGLTESEDPAAGASTYGGHVSGSYHYQTDRKGHSEALDISGSSGAMMAFDHWVARKYGAGVTELFYDPGISIKEGTRIGSIGGHSDHVHVAVAQPGAHFSGSVSGGISGGGSVTSGGSGSAPVGSPAAQKVRVAKGKRPLTPAQLQAKLKTLAREFNSTHTSTVTVSQLERKYGRPVV